MRSFYNAIAASFVIAISATTNLSADVLGLDLGLGAQFNVAASSYSEATKTRGFTVSSRGEASPARSYGFEPQPALPELTPTGTGSKFGLTKTKDGKMGDLALTTKDGGRVSMKLRETFVRIQYTLDF